MKRDQKPPVDDSGQTDKATIKQSNKALWVALKILDLESGFSKT